ncbi:MAG: CDP-alcohol phosphatidyltransferase family protein [Bacteroidaceae bacterium]|nr:CDP-alcohol phosphatidyltransferase family protein [Bacteroidaceae bacterium]
MNLKQRVLSTMKSREVESDFELYVTRTPGYLWALFFRWLNVHPIAVTLMSIVIGSASAYFFLFDDICYNLIGMLLLIWANWYDCADGQLARMTGKKTLVGRVLDGFAGNVWAFFIYIALLLRMWPEWGITIFILESWAGFYCHSRQCALADYYRNIHLWVALGKGDSELDTSIEQQRRMESLRWNKKEWFEKFYLFFYVRYTRSQERQTPEFQLIKPLLDKLPVDNPIRQQFRKESLPLMPLCNILTFDTRVGVLFLSLLVGHPWIYIIFEITVLEILRFYTRHRHEALCHKLRQKLSPV